MRSSLRRRILTLSAATTLVVVGGVSLFVWVLMSRSLRRSFDDALRSEAMALSSRMEEERGRVEFDWHESPRRAGADGEGPLIQVMMDDGEEIFASQGMLRLRLQALEASGAEPGATTWMELPLGRSGRRLRYVALRVTAWREEEDGSFVAGSRRGWIIVARRMDPLEHSLRQLAVTLIVATGLGGLAGLALGAVVSAVGIRPTLRVADRLRQVRPERPALEIDRQSVPVELAPVVSTIDELLSRIRGELERQRQLTADVAHDLRTPVAGVRTLLDVSAQRPRTAAEYVETIETARAAMRQLGELIDNVLTLARLDAQIDEPRWESVSIPGAFSSVVAAVQPMAAARGVRIRAEPGHAQSVRADRQMLETILRNLLHNAVEHGPANEEVRLTADALADGLYICVEDRGPGIPRERRERLFDRFVRGDESRAAGGHHGLGLPIARGLARLMHGDVYFDESAAGTRVVVRLSNRVGEQPRATAAQ